MTQPESGEVVAIGGTDAGFSAEFDGGALQVVGPDSNVIECDHLWLLRLEDLQVRFRRYQDLKEAAWTGFLNARAYWWG